MRTKLTIKYSVTLLPYPQRLRLAWRAWLYCFITLLFAPRVASADATPSLLDVLKGKNPFQDVTDLGQWAWKIPDCLMDIGGIIFLFVLVFGGIKYMTAMGNPEGSEKAKNTLLYGVIGIVIVALGKVFIAWFNSTVGGI